MNKALKRRLSPTKIMRRSKIDNVCQYYYQICLALVKTGPIIEWAIKLENGMAERSFVQLMQRKMTYGFQ